MMSSGLSSEAAIAGWVAAWRAAGPWLALPAPEPPRLLGWRPEVVAAAMVEVAPVTPAVTEAAPAARVGNVFDPVRERERFDRARELEVERREAFERAERERLEQQRLERERAIREQAERDRAERAWLAEERARLIREAEAREAEARAAPGDFEGYGHETEHREGYGREAERREGYAREAERREGYGRDTTDFDADADRNPRPPLFEPKEQQRSLGDEPAPSAVPLARESRAWDDPFAPASPKEVATARVPAPDPWAIMPSRTLRGAGFRPQVRSGDEELPPETLQERVERAPAEPTPPRPAPVALWDVLIVPTQEGFRTSEQGIKALVLYLDRAQLLRSPTVLSLEEFVGHPLHIRPDNWRTRMRGGDGDDTRLITLEAGSFAHQIFYEGAAPKDGPAVQKAHIGTRSKPAPVPFGPENRLAAFWIALEGCRFSTPSRGFLERLHSILYLRPVVHAVPHHDIPSPS
jgi:hypothetical protein